jgi:hypothetical protein
MAQSSTKDTKTQLHPWSNGLCRAPIPVLMALNSGLLASSPQAGGVHFGEVQHDR